jgi:NodT family efflux transporter outer membrane factor (OMF) lipoprotein
VFRFNSLAAVLIAGGLASSCTMGRDYDRPAVELPDTHRFETAPASSASLADVAWFDLFRDDTLTSLVKTALDRNFDLRIASERVLQARAAYGISRAERLPSVNASADAIASRASREGAAAGIPEGADTDVSYLQAGFGLAWELDVWGRIRRQNEAARARYLATEAGRHAVQTTLVADVLETYTALRALDLELEIAERTREIASEGLRLTEARRTGGVASGLDVRQAEQLLYTATGQIASIRREIALTEHALSLLLGQAPREIPRGAPLSALNTPPAVPAGLPSTLLERRPDIRQAEQELIAANAEIGAVKAAYFPRISLTGFLGVQSRALTDLLTGGAGFASAGLGAAAPLFDGGRRRGNVQLAEAIQRETLVAYERAIYTALREVADGLASHQRASEQRAQQERLVEALGESSRLAVERYRGGLDSYLPVLDAQRQLFQGELALARLRQLEVVSVVRLYRALGGGWGQG